METNYSPDNGGQSPHKQWTELLKKELNPAQYDFVTATEPALLGLAGPGSGKTRALIYRAAHLIKSGSAPESLLLLTFTNKAAEEMKIRLEDLLGFWPGDLWAGTFHSIGARILRRNASLVGRSPNFTILDEDDSKSIIKQIVSGLDIDSEEKKLLLKRGLLGRIISQSRNSGMEIRDVMEEEYPYRLEYLEIVKQVAAGYEKKKVESNAFDFDDLLLCWLDLFQNNPGVAAHYRERFKQVLVDEFQDTNVIQAAIIELFAKDASLCVVGDDAQSIYAFRFANIDNILTFQDKHARCEVVRMEQNYRSTPEIVELANCSIGFNREQLPKKLFSKNEPGEKPLTVKVRDARQEAAYVLKCINKLIERGVSAREIAVLYRSSYLTPEVEFALNSNGISYRTFGGVKFFQKAHIKDVLAYLKVAYNSLDEHAWRRIATLQQGLGPASFNTLWSRLKEHPQPLDAALAGKEEPARGKEGWRDLCETLGALQRDSGGDVPQLIENILNLNYDQILKNNYPDQYEDRLHGIERLALYAERFNNLDAFLESLVLEESVFAGVEAAGSAADGQLTLSTIHSAKGKEWDAVFIIGMNQGHFPSSRAGDEHISEERRLFYVAATRARRFLYLTTYRDDFRSYGAVSEGPSLFLRELSPDCYTMIDFEYGF